MGLLDKILQRTTKESDEIELYKSELDRFSNLQNEYISVDNLYILKKYLEELNSKYKREEVEAFMLYLNKKLRLQTIDKDLKKDCIYFLRNEVKIFSFSFLLIKLNSISKHILYFKLKNLEIENFKTFFNELQTLTKLESLVFKNILEFQNLKNYLDSKKFTEIDESFYTILENLVNELERHTFKLNSN